MFAQVSNATIFPRYPQIAFAGLNMRCPCSIRGKKVWAGPWTHAETRPKADLEKQIADNTIRHLFQLKEVGVPHPIDAQQTQSSRRRKKKIGNIKYNQFTKKRKQKREEKEQNINLAKMTPSNNPKSTSLRHLFRLDHK